MPLQALFGELSWDVTILTVLYSIAGLGIAIVNDFKSIEGDRCGLVSVSAEACGKSSRYLHDRERLP